MEHSQPRPLSARNVALAAFVAVAILFFPASQAQAGEAQFCSGKSLALLSGGGLCKDSSSRWITAVYGTGSQATCAGAWGGPFLCTGGPDQGVYVGKPHFDGSQLYQATLYNNSGEKGDKVYGTVWFNQSGPQPPPAPQPPPPPSWHIQNLGGMATSDPDISSWGPNRLDVWARGTDNALWHKWWNGSSWNGWEKMSGGAIASGPGAVSWGANRIDVVARATDGKVLHWWWNGSSWQTENLGGEIQSDPDISTWSSSRYDLWARGTDNLLWHRWWPGTTWMPWENQSPSATFWGSPGAVSVGDNLTYVVGRESNDTTVLQEWR